MEKANLLYIGRIGKVESFTKNIPGLGDQCKIWTLSDTKCVIVNVSDDGFYITVRNSDQLTTDNSYKTGFLSTDIGIFPMEYIRCHVSYFKLDENE